MEYVREGDTIYIKDFSRLSRSTSDLLNIIETLEKRKITLISLKENMSYILSMGKAKKLNTRKIIDDNIFYR